MRLAKDDVCYVCGADLSVGIKFRMSYTGFLEEDDMRYHVESSAKYLCERHMNDVVQYIEDKKIRHALIDSCLQGKSKP